MADYLYRRTGEHRPPKACDCYEGYNGVPCIAAIDRREPCWRLRREEVPRLTGVPLQHGEMHTPEPQAAEPALPSPEDVAAGWWVGAEDHLKFTSLSSVGSLRRLIAEAIRTDRARRAPQANTGIDPERARKVIDLCHQGIAMLPDAPASAAAAMECLEHILAEHDVARREAR